MVFIRLMKDKTGGSQVQNGLHKADEGQNSREPGLKCQAGNCPIERFYGTKKRVTSRELSHREVPWDKKASDKPGTVL
ncbi:hypothetical protein CHR53_01500 [Neobacillus mesonae]|uniref:Uncharacterized protein n=1 Tax=Neobacillus mesonae TaxID=1193713 RepID=A0A3Q9QQU5_9BACI|nr:hypothetical protein CHR53_01500 [Neobacillus mesonae]